MVIEIPKGNKIVKRSIKTKEDYKFYLKANTIKSYPQDIEYEDQNNEDLCLLAVQADGMVLEKINNQTVDICKVAIKQNPEAIRFAKEQDEEMCLLAVQVDGMILEKINNQTVDICRAAVKQNPEAIRFAKEQDEEMCLIAVQHNGYLIEYVENQTKKICRAAVKQNPLAIKFVREQYKSLCHKTFYTELEKKKNKRKDIFKHIDDKFKSSDMCLKALDISLKNVRHIPEHLFDENIVNKIVVTDGGLAYIQHIPKQFLTYNICKLAIIYDVRLFEFVPEEYYPINDHELEYMCIKILKGLGKTGRNLQRRSSVGILKNIRIFQKSELITLYMMNDTSRYIMNIDEKYQTKAICEKALKDDISNIKYIHDPSEEMILYVMDSKDYTEAYHGYIITKPNITEKICNRLLEEDASLIAHFSKSEKLCMKALNIDNDILKLISESDRTDEMYICVLNNIIHTILKDVDESRKKNIINNLLK